MMDDLHKAFWFSRVHWALHTPSELQSICYNTSVMVCVICAKLHARNTFWHRAWKYRTHFIRLLEIAFITETMLESSKSGKSIGCSVAINNRLETSRH